MSKVQVLDKTGRKVSEITLPKEIFSYPFKEHLIYEAVVNYNANQRRGTASAKTRSEMRGGGKKPWRQKGTGRARAGSIRSPIWRAGGVTFGPKYRSFKYNMPKRAKKDALKSAFSMKSSENKIVIFDSLDFNEPKTKLGVEFLEKAQLKSALLIDIHSNKNLFLSLRNIPGVKAVDYSQVNIYDVLNYEHMVFSQKAFESLMERLK
ncbi:MAG: 50S ribosomal protein L4 [Candidatus Aminicenantaceae bacterium]